MPRQTVESIKRQILDRIALDQLIANHVTLKRAGRRFVGLCPFHAEKTPSFTVSPELGLFKCFGCGKGGDIFSFVQFHENVSFSEALHILADRAGVRLEESALPAGTQTGPSHRDLTRLNEWAQKFFQSKLRDESIGRAARDYLRSRSLTQETVTAFGLGLACSNGASIRMAAAKAGFSDSLLLAADLLRRGEDGTIYETFRDRLIFPIRDSMNRVLGFGGRTLVDDRAKYLNTRQTSLFEKGRILYGIERARSRIVEKRRAIVVEGYTDCLACHQAGLDETVATLGTALTEAHVELLRRNTEQIVLLFDSDDAGEAAGDRAIALAVPVGMRVLLVKVPSGKDPCDLLETKGSEGFSDVLNGAVDALEFKWSRTVQRFGGALTDLGRREAIVEYLRFIADAANARAVDSIQRGLLVNQVARLLEMNSADVARRLPALRTSRRPAPTVMAGATRPAPRDAEQAAWTHWLEASLNDPALLRSLDAPPDFGRIGDQQDRRIASLLWQVAEECSEPAVADLLARCCEDTDAERVAELVHRGQERGNLEATFRLAVCRIADGVRESRMEATRERILKSDDAFALIDATPEDREIFSQGVSEHRHYAPRRMRRGASRSLGLDEAGQKETKKTMTETP